MALLAVGTTSVGGALTLRARASSSSFSTLSYNSSLLSFSRTESLASGGSYQSLSATSLAPATAPDAISHPLVYCGRGDKKTARGKRFRHSFGNCRPCNKKKGRGPSRAPMPPSPTKKDKFGDGEIIKIDIDESLFS